jgi:hypothetical protein
MRLVALAEPRTRRKPPAQPSPTPADRRAVMALARRGVRPVTEMLLRALPLLPPHGHALVMGEIARINTWSPDQIARLDAANYSPFRPRAVPADLGEEDEGPG